MAEKILRKREDIPEEYKWKLEDMFASDEQWEQETEELLSSVQEVEKYKGRLGESAGNLYLYFKKLDELVYHADRVYVYANQRLHQDTTVAKYQGYSSKADAVLVSLQSAIAFADPEILTIPEQTIEQFYKDEPQLLHYKRKIDEIKRMKEHTLSETEEALLAQVGELAAAPGNIYSMFNNADIKFPYITDVEGNRIQITHGNYIDMLKSTDRSMRKQAFFGVYDTYKKWGNTVTATYLAQLKRDNFYAKVRKYSSAREMYLSKGNIPESVYDNLIKTVNSHLPALHRYMAVRKERLGVDKLRMYDLFVSVVDDVEKKYTYQQAKELVATALAPMGQEYVNTLKEGMEGGWIDVYENENKRSGAYSWGAYGTHPYVLLNHQDNINSVFTLAHEIGHAMHTYYSNSAPEITYADYLIFVAEVASTCNEALLMHYLFENTKDQTEKEYLIFHYLDKFRTTLFRQAQFAEFEHEAHRLLDNGQAVTMESLNKLYFDINARYYGPGLFYDQAIEYEWMRIPHFYKPYYVYQYSTGFSAAIAFSKMILEEGAPAVERYVNNFLKGGCSKDPIDLLAAAGVDMSTSKPIEDALDVFEQYLIKLEEG